MDTATLDCLRCPSCHGTLVTVDWERAEQRLTSGALACGRCDLHVPVCAGFPLFLDVQHGAPDQAAIEVLARKRIGTRAEYDAFLHHKRLRPSIDLYAAFRPFNESSRAIAPFIEMLRESFRPGDRILDLWCRTGWTGEWLAATFPEQHVVSVWESASDVLGTRGFAHWLGGSERRHNLDIVFHDPNQPLPFADNAFTLVHGLDTLHRYDVDTLVPECVRVGRKDGVLAFPHVHLSNAEPEPFFERGGVQRSGGKTHDLLESAIDTSRRSVFVMSERRLFEESRGTPLRDEPDTTHYNGCIVVCDSSQAGRELREESPTMERSDAWRVIRNPLVDVDLSTGAVAIQNSALHGGVADMLERHPPFAERLAQVLPSALNPFECQLLYWAERGRTVRELAEVTGATPETVLAGLGDLERAELVKLAGISESMAHLQTYYGTQSVRTSASATTIPEVWRATVARHADEIYLEWTDDGSEFTYAATDQLIHQVAGCFQARGIGRGDRVLLHAVSHPEFVLACLGALHLGAIVASVDPELGAERVHEVTRNFAPDLAILSASCESTLESAVEGSVLHFEGRNVAPEHSFLEAVLGSATATELPTLTESDPAMVLFTSGSTGRPKGVLLSHGGLVRSSRSIDRVHPWTREDRFHCPASPHTMSAFRNAVLTPWIGGARTVLDNSDGPMRVLTTCIEQGVTILNTTPAFLAYCVRLEGRSEMLRGHCIRMVLCTGSALQPGLRRRFEALTGARVFDYYGLTETSGVCTFVGPPEAHLEDPGIGRPVDTRITVMNPDGQAVPDGDIGELVIETENLALGIITPGGIEPIDRVRNGQLHTGDLVRRDASGCLVLVGRSDRMLVDRGGENLHPEEIERALDRQIGVVSSHVTSRDRDGLEEVVALVALDRSVCTGGEVWTAGILEGLRKVLAAAHVPSHVIEVEDPPIEPAGVWNSEAVQEILNAHLS